MYSRTSFVPWSLLCLGNSGGSRLEPDDFAQDLKPRAEWALLLRDSKQSRGPPFDSRHGSLRQEFPLVPGEGVALVPRVALSGVRVALWYCASMPRPANPLGPKLNCLINCKHQSDCRDCTWLLRRMPWSQPDELHVQEVYSAPASCALRRSYAGPYKLDASCLATGCYDLSVAQRAMFQWAQSYQNILPCGNFSRASFLTCCPSAQNI